MVSSLNVTYTLLSTLLSSTVLNLTPITSIRGKYNPRELTAEKINSTIDLLDETAQSMKANGKHVKAFALGQFKDVLETVGDQVEILKNYQDDDRVYQYLEYLQLTVNVLESYAQKYRRG